MTKSAMNNNKRTKPVMTNATIKKEAYKAGYKYTGYSTWECEACKEEMELAIQAIGYTGTKPSWADAHIALKFRKKGSTVVACRCGWRKDVSKPVCKVRGCNHILNKTDTDGLCVPCRKEIEGGGNPALWALGCQYKPEGGCSHFLHRGVEACAQCSPPLICKTKTCNNPVPKGRKAYCHECVPPAANKVKEPKM
jgi:hypothetical protein